MKALLIILITIILSPNNLCIAQEKIRWERNDDLRWKNFKADPLVNSPMAAETFTRTEFLMSFMDGKFSWKIDCYFSPSESWVKPDLESDGLLAHEQLHFDIAELHARIIRDRMSNLILVGLKDGEKLQSIFENGLQEQAEMQEQYDLETEHGVKIEAQKIWEKKIKSDLKNLKEFSSANYEFE